MNIRNLIVLAGLGLLLIAVERVRPDPMAERHAAVQQAAITKLASESGSTQGSASLVLLDSAAAQLSFQALLTNDQGGPINMPNGQHELDFRIYGVAAGGAPIGGVLNVLVTLDHGVASTYVGPLDSDWFDGTARWLGVTVDNGDELLPRALLGAVPYAMRVDRVASVELDDDIDLGGPAALGRLDVHSGAGQGRITLHGLGQLMETRSDAGQLVALYGYDALGGGAACLLGTSVGTTGLLLDGNQSGAGGGHVVLYDNDAVDAVSLEAATSTVRIGSPNAGAAGGNLHLFPSSGAPSRIHLDGQNADLRLGVSGFASGDLRLFAGSGGIETFHLAGGTRQLSVTDGVQETVRLDGDGSDGGGGIVVWNSAGLQTVEIDADEADQAALRLWDGAGTNTVEIEARQAPSAPGAQVVLRNAAGAPAIILDAELGIGGLGRITTTGSLGIGTETPEHELVVQGNDPAVQIRDDTTDNSANAARLELLERAGGAFDGGGFLWWNGETNKLHVGTKLSGTSTSVLVVDRATNGVGIGTQEPGDYRLAVNGSIRAKEIVVETGWSDFVFEPDYDLASLEEVEAHIEAHGHLPDIPSAAEVEKNGVKLGEMDSKLLQKIEEMTLHMIELNKRVGVLEAENQRLQRRLAGRTCDEGRAE
jgi:hypothetical protein